MPRRKKSQRHLLNKGRVGAALRLESLECRTVPAGLVWQESTFELAEFEANLREQVEDDVIGFSYAMSRYNPANPIAPLEQISGAGGIARMPWDNPSGPFPIAAAANRPQEIASISKTITAAAILHLLQEQTGIDPEQNPQQFTAAMQIALDQSISNFVPGNWNTTTQFDSITIRELLTHTSGIRNAEVGNYNYAALQNFAQTGTLAAKVPFYSTYNYSFFRVMLPYMWNAVNLVNLNNNANSNQLNLLALSGNPFINGQLATAIIQDWNPPVIGPNIVAITPDRVTASIYRYYVTAYILQPAGVVAPGLQPEGVNGQGAPNHTLHYTLAQPAVGADFGDERRNAGSRGWNLSAEDVELFMSAIRFDDTMLAPATRQLMDDEFLGWREAGSPGSVAADFTGIFGRYFGHDGTNDPTGVNPDRNNTIAMTFPNGVQASLLVNSQMGPGFGAAFNPGGTISVARVTMRDAYDNAWTGLVYEGFDSKPLPNIANDSFALTANANPLFVDFLHNGQVMFTRRADTLQYLEINGLGGNDTLTLSGLPTNLQLTIVFNGGAGHDTIFVEDLPSKVVTLFNGNEGSDLAILCPGNQDLQNIKGNFIFAGGDDTGTDQLRFFDTQTPFWFASIYTMDATSLERSNLGQVAQFFDLESVSLFSSQQASIINVNETALGTKVNLTTGPNNDTIVLGDTAASSNLQSSILVETGFGMDSLVIDDSAGSVADDTYVLQSSYFQSQLIDVISWNAAAPPEIIHVLTSNQDSTINVRGIGTGGSVTIDGLGGDDDFRIHAVPANTSLRLNGHAGNETFTFTPETGDLSAIRGSVIVDAGTGQFDSIDLRDQSASKRKYEIANNEFDVIGSAFGNLSYDSGLETLSIQAGASDDLLNVVNHPASTLVALYGNGGNDTFDVSAQAQNLGQINGALYFSGGAGIDSLRLYDQKSIVHIVYNVVTGFATQITRAGFEVQHFGVDDVALYANAGDNYINIGGTPGAPTSYVIDTGPGEDEVSVAALASVTVTVHGNTGVDSLHVVGTSVDDVVSLVGDRISIGETTAMIGSSVEKRSLDAGQGLDVLEITGRSDMNEYFHVQATATAGAGRLSATAMTPLDFARLEDIDVRGNIGNRDRLIFAGTDSADDFDVNPVAQGTADDPVVNFHQGPSGSLLRIRNYEDVGTATLNGGAGPDTFRVTMMPLSTAFPIRSVRLVGNEKPTRGSDDTLILSHNPLLFQLLDALPKPGSGQIRFGTPSGIVDIIFDSIETIEADFF